MDNKKFLYALGGLQKIKNCLRTLRSSLTGPSAHTPPIKKNPDFKLTDTKLTATWAWAA
jgi:hypothetical protein